MPVRTITTKAIPVKKSSVGKVKSRVKQLGKDGIEIQRTQTSNKPVPAALTHRVTPQQYETQTPLVSREMNLRVSEQLRVRTSTDARGAATGNGTAPVENIPQLRPSTMQRRNTGMHIVRHVALTVLVAACAGGLVWYLFTDTQTAAQKKEAYMQSIVKKVAHIALIPPNEVPTIGVIPDPMTIQENKEFFKNATQGDYLLIFPNARLMVIYSPLRNIVINMGYAGTEEVKP